MSRETPYPRAQVPRTTPSTIVPVTTLVTRVPMGRSSLLDT